MLLLSPVQQKPAVKEQGGTSKHTFWTHVVETLALTKAVQFVFKSNSGYVVYDTPEVIHQQLPPAKLLLFWLVIDVLFAPRNGL